MPNKKTIRVRFAPSPTGFLHIGGLRTTLFNYLFAKKNKGVFILRIEDTDQSRLVPQATEKLIKALDDIDLRADEGVYLDKKGQISQQGKFGPYIQSQRLNLYQEAAQDLVKKGAAYYCFCSSDRLEELREKQQSNKQVPKYDGHCRNLDPKAVAEKLANTKKFVIRFKVPENIIITAQDLIYGEIKVKSEDLDDFVLQKSDGFPTYHLANIVDDHSMEISHVIRGEEWLASLPKHILLYQAFGFTPPTFVHLPLLLNPDKSKLSKRQGDVAVEDYLSKGYLPAALINYIALLGWNPGTEQEVFSLNELIKNFSLEKINKSGAVFDVKKLQWLNNNYIKKYLEDKKLYPEILNLTKKFLPEQEEQIPKLLKIFGSRLNYLAEIKDLSAFIFQLPDYPGSMLIFKKSDSSKTKQGLTASLDMLNKYKEGDWIENKLFEALNSLIKAQNLTPGDVFWPIRVSVSGLEKSPSPAEILAILGKKESINRIELGLAKIK